ncbi:hypothetical protein CWS35_15705 [Bradyrhizobium sp. SK17]|uniref:DUF1656 domain-containing protein n=1 Tax=Bradyrhizobium sp. SK17 TaxID=2057741 RepID=UPI000C319181|nr:DUF1656 domain-containing protein [Bradyrhizobium sp. SK17]AUC95515.1 hypothetical protein CWS35_15705 [Bradyrhizobium sp. SK17]
MTQAYRELVIGGVLVAPIVTYALITIVAILLLRPILHRIGFANLFSNPPVAELSLYVVIFGLLALSY